LLIISGIQRIFIEHYKKSWQASHPRKDREEYQYAITGWLIISGHESFARMGAE
jgi:hypothetical protein